MQEKYSNIVKARLKNKEKVSAAWLHMASNISAEIMANAGFDVLFIDMEHSPVDYETVLSMCQAVKATGATPVARAPWNDLIALKRLHDCGVMGVSIPYVNTKEEAQTAVAYCKYPPLGLRGIAGSPRAAGFGLNLDNYLQRANDENIVMIAIETEEGIKNLPDIMSINDIDGIFIGPMDLSTSMGIMGQFDHPDFKSAVKAIEDIVLPSDKFLVTVASTFEKAKDLYNKGYSMVVMMSDVVDLAKIAKQRVEEFKSFAKDN